MCFLFSSCIKIDVVCKTGMKTIFLHHDPHDQQPDVTKKTTRSSRRMMVFFLSHSIALFLKKVVIRIFSVKSLTTISRILIQRFLFDWIMHIYHNPSFLFTCDFHSISYSMETPQLQNCVFSTLTECWQIFTHICNGNAASERRKKAWEASRGRQKMT